MAHIAVLGDVSGPPGKNGENGLSAFQAAQQAGYTGTEDQFNQLMASYGDSYLGHYADEETLVERYPTGVSGNWATAGATMMIWDEENQKWAQVQGGGSLVAAGSNPNLLDNCYFPDPINQKEQTEYGVNLPANSITIDRWHKRAAQEIVRIQGGYIEFEGTGNYQADIHQLLENPKRLVGKTLTFSVIAKGDGTNAPKIAVSTGAEDVVYVPGTSSTDWQLLSGTFTANESTIMLLRCYASINTNVYPVIGVLAAKLELGDRQTLAHQDESGNWVLNDPPPNKQQELAKCQRYFVRVKVPDNGGDMNASLFLGSSFPYLANRTSLGFWLPQPMRIKPTVKVENNSYGTGIMGHNYSRNIEYMNVVPIVNLMSNNYLEFVFTSATQPFVVGESINYELSIGASINFDANL